MSDQAARYLSPRARQLPLLAVSTSHFLNDLLQALLIASYPLIHTDLALDFSQLGLLTLVYQFTASVFQPLVGAFTDRHAPRWSLMLGMSLSGSGIFTLGMADSYAWLLIASVLLGFGSAIFHPEAARLARRWAREKLGWGQSLFQLGGSLGSMAGPLVTALVVLPNGQGSIAWFSALAAVGVLLAVFLWSADASPSETGNMAPVTTIAQTAPMSEAAPTGQLGVLFALVCAKYVYLACFGSYLVFYLETEFDVPVASGLVVLFCFHAATAGGGLIGGTVSDRIGTRRVIAFSFWGAVPFALAFPHLGLFPAVAAAILASAIIASAFPAIVVHAQGLAPSRIGVVSGLFYGTAFGVGGLASAAFGWLADVTSIATTFDMTAWCPLVGLIALRLRENRPERSEA
ncbi:MFS transporter [Celeribacter indicus]|uniref:Major facilitator superfamily protein n=1 Tax=Celeribacter indicus TaxID=1208324 RepID=A0A0B5DZ53_9RHOB|nr:MFS transporter [Celeribacter indicus]AJE46011.1 major facilitator superfamily protein [Celeribacter indicus]SDX32813.1 MFS transporter, FSR family, fosmidomycin resistance protein [Celeribacter indicus]